MTKILINASMYTPNPTGVGIYSREVYNRLSKLIIANGDEFTCYSYSNHKLLYTEKIKKIRLPFPFEVFLKRFESLHRVVWNFFYLPIIAGKYHLVYSFSSHGSPFVKTQVITIHDLICFAFPKQHKFQFLYFKYLLPLIIRASKKVIAISEFTKTEIIKHYKTKPEKIEVILNGGDHLQTNSNTSVLKEEAQLEQFISANKFFLCVGASYPHKNAGRLIAAMSVLPVDVYLIITGAKNNYLKQLQNAASRKRLNNIVFIPYASPALLNLLYKNCIANIYISLYEGFGFPPLEAAINNKLSVIANTTALPEIYKDAVVYVNPKNVSEISNILSLAVSSQLEAEKYQEKFPELINKYKWNNTSEKIYGVLRNQGVFSVLG